MRLKRAKAVADGAEIALWVRRGYSAEAVEEVVEEYREDESAAEFAWKLGFAAAVDAYHRGEFEMSVEQLEKRYSK